MKILNIVVIVIFSIFFLSCASTRSGNINKQDDCKVPGLDWMEGVEGYDKKETSELAAEFEAAARAAAGIVKDANAEGSLIKSLQKISNNKTGRKVKVSQEFFQQANAYRTKVCAIEGWLKDGTLSDSTMRVNAQRLLLDFSVGFNSIATEFSELKDDIKNIREDLNEKNGDIRDLKVKAKKAERGISTTYDANGIKRETGPGKFFATWGLETQIYIEMQTLEQQKKYQELIPICEEWIEKTPEWLSPYYYLGIAYDNLGNKEKAIELFEYVQSNALGDPAYSQVNDFLKRLKGN